MTESSPQPAPVAKPGRVSFTGRGSAALGAGAIFVGVTLLGFGLSLLDRFDPVPPYAVSTGMQADVPMDKLD